MATFSESGVQVHLNLNHTVEKKGFEPDMPSDSSPVDTKAAAVMWSSRTLWTLFALGWVIAPCWWVGVAAGLRVGNDGQCLIKRKRGLSPAQSAAWWSNVVLTVLSTAALILVTSMYYGRMGPIQQGPFYLTLAVPADAFPNMRDAAKMAAVAKAVHAGFNLGDDYKSTNIAVWLQAQTAVTPELVRHRHMLAAGSNPVVAVLGYTLLVTEQLPAKAELVAMMGSAAVTEAVAQKLADEGFVKEEDLGRLSVRVESHNLNLLATGTPANLAAESMVPIGRVDCQGVWTPVEPCPVYQPGRRLLLATRQTSDTWAPCGPDGSTMAMRDEMFNITVQPRAGGANCNNTDGDLRAVECVQPCPPGSCLAPPDFAALNINTTATLADLKAVCSYGWAENVPCKVAATCPDTQEAGEANIRCDNGQYVVTYDCGDK